MIFLRDDADIGVQRIYTDAEVQSFLSTGPFFVASESENDLSADGFDGVHTEEVARIDMVPEPSDPVDELNAGSDDCDGDDGKHAETNADGNGPAPNASGGSGVVYREHRIEQACMGC